MQKCVKIIWGFKGDFLNTTTEFQTRLFDRFWRSASIIGQERSWSDRWRSDTIRNGQEWTWMVKSGQKLSQMVNWGKDCSETDRKCLNNQEKLKVYNTQRNEHKGKRISFMRLRKLKITWEIRPKSQLIDAIDYEIYAKWNMIF